MSNLRDHKKLRLNNKTSRAFNEALKKSVKTGGGFMALLGYLENSLSKLIGSSTPATPGDGNLMQELGAHLSRHDNERATEAYLDLVLDGGDHVDVLRQLEQDLTPEQGHLHDTSFNLDTDTGQLTPEFDAQQDNIVSPQTPATAAILQPEGAGDCNLAQNRAAPPVEDADGTAPELPTAPPQHLDQASDASAAGYYANGQETAADAYGGPEGGHWDFAGGSFDSFGNNSGR